MNDLIAYQLEQETRRSLKNSYRELTIFFDELVFPQEYLTYPNFSFKANNKLSTEFKDFLKQLAELHYEEIRFRFLLPSKF